MVITGVPVTCTRVVTAVPVVVCCLCLRTYTVVILAYILIMQNRVANPPLVVPSMFQLHLRFITCSKVLKTLGIFIS